MMEVLIPSGVSSNFDSCKVSWEKLGEIMCEWVGLT